MEVISGGLWEEAVPAACGSGPDGAVRAPRVLVEMMMFEAEESEMQVWQLLRAAWRSCDHSC